MHSLILKVATRLLVGLILVFAVYLLFRGHNAPGGGFVAALVAGTGFALAAVSEGPAVVRRAIRIDPERIAMCGLGLAILCGLVGWLAGRPFFDGSLVDRHDRPIEGAGHRHPAIFRYRGFSNGIGCSINPYFGIGRKLTWKPYSPF